VVPLVVEGAEVDAWDIASSLIVLMLIPLAVGRFIKARYEEFADGIVGQVG
jgi:BASS family bile acid:Na+ symporter